MPIKEDKSKKKKTFGQWQSIPNDVIIECSISLIWRHTFLHYKEPHPTVQCSDLIILLLVDFFSNFGRFFGFKIESFLKILDSFT